MVVDEILEEMLNQRATWGEQNHEPLRYFGILAEEVLEASREAQEATFAADVRDRTAALSLLRYELIQVAAVAGSFVECLDRGKFKVTP